MSCALGHGVSFRTPSCGRFNRSGRDGCEQVQSYGRRIVTVLEQNSGIGDGVFYLRARHLQEWLRLSRRTAKAEGSQHSSVVLCVCRQSRDAENGREHILECLQMWLATFYYIEEFNIQFDAIVGFAETRSSIHGIGVYGVERDPRRQTYDDDLNGPRPRLVVHAMTRGEDDIERWVHVLEPISSSYTGRDANMSSLRACPQEAAPEEDGESVWLLKCSFSAGGLRQLLSTSKLVWKLLLRYHMFLGACLRAPYSLLSLR